MRGGVGWGGAATADGSLDAGSVLLLVSLIDAGCGRGTGGSVGGASWRPATDTKFRVAAAAPVCPCRTPYGALPLFFFLPLFPFVSCRRRAAGALLHAQRADPRPREHPHPLLLQARLADARRGARRRHRVAAASLWRRPRPRPRRARHGRPLHVRRGRAAAAAADDARREPDLVWLRVWAARGRPARRWAGGWGGRAGGGGDA